MKNKTLLLCLSFAIAAFTAKAQIQVDHLSTKNFKATGFGAFFNLSYPVSEAAYITGEIGFDIFSSNDDNVGVAPLIAGYRYTLNRTGTGFYVEPNAGYSFGGSDIQLYDGEGHYYDQKVSGAVTGLTFGYLFPPSQGRMPIQFNVGMRYEHIFAPAGINMFSLRISHAFCFGRRN